MDEKQYMKAMKNCISMLKRKAVTNAEDNYIRLMIRTLRKDGVSLVDVIGELNASFMHDSGYTEKHPLATDFTEILYRNPKGYCLREIPWGY